MTTTPYAKLTTWALIAWFALELALAATGKLIDPIGHPPIHLLLAIVGPLAAFFLAFSLSRGFREYLLSLSPRLLTSIQSSRVEGIVFLVLARYRILDPHFALTAGWGDIFIGITAIYASIRLAQPAHRRLFIFWQLLGVADLLTAVSMGVYAGIRMPSGIPNLPMVQLPLSLIPSFAVPFFFLLHILCIVQARRWKQASNPDSATRLQPIAA